MHFLRHFAADGDVVVDVGANGADWTLALSRQVGRQGTVYAFEADPYYAEVTRKTVQLLGLKNVVFFPFGLSDRSENVLLRIRDKNGRRISGMGTVVRKVDEESPSRNKYVNIKLERLDSIAESYTKLFGARLIKCDVEGFELMVFRGAETVLRRARPVVIVEVGGAHLHGYTDDELFQFFNKIHYTSYVAVSASCIRRSTRGGAIDEGLRPNRIMLPKEYHISKDIAVLEAGSKTTAIPHELAQKGLET